jgi:hypothetical protein
VIVFGAISEEQLKELKMAHTKEWWEKTEEDEKANKKGL